MYWMKFVQGTYFQVSTSSVMQMKWIEIVVSSAQEVIKHNIMILDNNIYGDREFVHCNGQKLKTKTLTVTSIPATTTIACILEKFKEYNCINIEKKDVSLYFTFRTIDDARKAQNLIKTESSLKGINIFFK